MSFSGIEIIAWPNPQPDGEDVILAKIEVSPNGIVDAWRVDGEGSHIAFDMNPVPDSDKIDLFSLIELLAKMCKTVDADGDAARAEFSGAVALDCYPTSAEAERWHAIDERHVRNHGYGRNHWS